MKLNCDKTDVGVVVSCDYWEITHSSSGGGAWSSIVFGRGSGKNLLARPASSMVRFAEAAPSGQGPKYSAYREANDHDATVDGSVTDDGGALVTAEGLYRDKRGNDVGLSFRRVTRYNRWGVAESELEITAPAEGPVEGVVEVCGLDMVIRGGMDRAFVKHHAMLEAGMAPGRGWLELPADTYACRYMPAHVIVFEEDVEGIELYGPSDPAEWDVAGHEGAGLYELRPHEKGGTYLALNAYCNAFRRVPVTLEGTTRLRVIFGLPFVKEREAVFNTVFHASAGSVWPPDEDIDAAAGAGLKLVRFHNDYREDGPFWHDGMYPPYDEAGMKELRRTVETAHRNGMRLVPYVSLKEFHPESPGYDENLDAWQRKEGLDGHVTHTYTGTGEFGGLMCMRSGWLDFRKRACDIMLTDIPWDGLYFDWTLFYSCCHDGHAKGWHHDTEEFLDFIVWARERVGDDGVLFTHCSSHPSLVLENVADIMFVGEHDGAFMPGEWHHECTFVPVTPRQLAVWRFGEPEASILRISGMLQGHPTCISLPLSGPRRPERIATSKRMLDEMRLFAGEQLASYRFRRASDRPVETGSAQVYASLHYKPGAALVYVGNLSGRKASGSLKVDLSARGVAAADVDLSWERLEPGSDGAAAGGAVTAGEIASAGLAYELEAWGSALYRIRTSE